MKFKENVLDYFTGKLFSHGLTIPIGNKNENFLTRSELIISLAKDIKIIHLGCCDHIPLIKEKIRDNSWLHSHLTSNSKQCIGIDINKEAVKFVTNDLGQKNIIYGDITAHEKISEIKDENYDLMIMGEILEHIDNPVLFLRQIRENYKNNISKILITVPNAFCYRNRTYALKNIEVINSDHRYWFTPYTLAKIAVRAGYQVEEFFFTDEARNYTGLRAKLLIIPYLKRKLLYFKLKNHPAIRTNLVMIIKL